MSGSNTLFHLASSGGGKLGCQRREVGGVKYVDTSDCVRFLTLITKMHFYKNLSCHIIRPNRSRATVNE